MLENFANDLRYPEQGPAHSLSFTHHLTEQLIHPSFQVAVFVGLVGLLAVLAQLCLGALMKNLGCKHTIMLGLLFEMLQLLWYGFGTTTWMMWAAGMLASMSSITYPAISAFVSIVSTPDRQGVVQGMVTGMRGLCNGLGPAMFGLIFYVFHVDLNEGEGQEGTHSTPVHDESYAQVSGRECGELFSQEIFWKCSSAFIVRVYLEQTRTKYKHPRY